VKWRSQSGPEPKTNVSGDGLDQDVWQMIYDILVAAHQGDAGAFIHATERLTQTLPLEGQRLAGAYFLYLLQYRVIDILGRRPTREDLRELAGRASPKYARLLRVEASLFEDTLLTTFKLASPKTEVKSGRFAVSSSATLGVLLDNPQVNLKVMRPHLAEWWCRNAEKFQDLGVG
jgi:hypothetical protein